MDEEQFKGWLKQVLLDQPDIDAVEEDNGDLTVIMTDGSWFTVNTLEGG